MKLVGTRTESFAHLATGTNRSRNKSAMPSGVYSRPSSPRTGSHTASAAGSLALGIELGFAPNRPKDLISSQGCVPNFCKCVPTVCNGGICLNIAQPGRPAGMNASEGR